MSRSARAASSTLYAMLSADFVEDFAGRAGAALLHILKPLPDPLCCIGLGGDVEKMLVGLRILQNGFRFPVNGKNQGTFVPFQAPHKHTRVAPETCLGLNVFADIEHTLSPAPKH